MKKLWVILIAATLLGAACSNEPQNTESVELAWKVDEGESIAFSANMDQLDPETETLIEFDIESMADGDGVSSSVRKDFSRFRLPPRASTTNILTGKPNGNISVKVIMNSFDVPQSLSSKMEQKLAGLLKEMEGTVQLRGEIDQHGQLTSFHLERLQANLVALWFELPAGPVKVGDTWSINAQLIGMGHGFISDDSKKFNQVKLTSLTDAGNGDKLATLEYVISEYVDGKLSHPRTGESQPCSMSAAFYAQAKFLVNEGTWLEFKGRMHMKSSGVMTADVQQHFTMEPLAIIPAQLLALE